MKKNIFKIIIYVLLGLYALMMFAGVIGSGAVVAIIFFGIVAGYILTMLVSIKSARRLEALKEKVMLNPDYPITKGDKPLLHAILTNLPFYFIYFVLSLIPMEFPALWIIAGLPCCVIAGLRPINKNYQVYNFITNKSKLYWLLQLILAVALWLGGRAIITFLVL
ncbi:MAG: hypothetical protein IKA43_05505 [Clostridia bacterium]|nr:hypothetical protein [Clostridia bacterium]